MTIINHECYVSLEVAKLLKEAGFNWKCNGAYLSEDGIQYAFIKMDEACDNNNSKYNQYNISAPTLDVAQRWLREEKGYHIYISHTYTAIDGQIKSIWEVLYEKMSFLKPNSILILEDDLGRSLEFDTYEEALEAGLQKCLTLLIEKL